MEGVREDLRGTYAGLASDTAIAYLRELGADCSGALARPPHRRRGRPRRARALNYSGYSTIGYLAPHAGYAATGTRGEQVREFKGMVKALHRAGIEVILDVVYNHTAEGSHLGPTLSFKGVDNALLLPPPAGRPAPLHGLHRDRQLAQPGAAVGLRLIMDSLRCFATEMPCRRVPLRPRLGAGAELYDVDRLSAFFDVIHQDPVLSQVKLIAEPWDVGPGGYQVGTSPSLWSEWNGMYRTRCATSGEDTRRSRSSRGGLPGRVTSTSPTAATRRRPSTSSPATTGSRSHDLVSYDRSTTRRTSRATRRLGRQPLVELRGGGRDGRPRGQRAPRPADPELPDDAAPLPGDADAARRRRAPAARRPGTTTPTARTTSSPGSTGTSTSAPAASSTSPAVFSASARSIRVPPLGVLDRRGAAGLRRPRRLVVPPDGRRMTQADWARGDAFALGAFLNGAEIRAGPQTASRSATSRSSSSSTPGGACLVRPPARAVRPAVDARALHGGARCAAER